MKRLLNLLVIGSLIFITTDCRDPFVPDFVSGVNDFLVVEGYINVGQKAVTKIILTRVSRLGVVTPDLEAKASVAIESEHGDVFPLTEKQSGKYFSDSLNLDTQTQYRLIINSDNKDYASDFVMPKITPPIDSMFWQWDDDGVKVYLATNGDGSTEFYKWTFEEAWEIRSDYVSKYSYINGKMEKTSGTQQNQLFMCWDSSVSDALRFASSTQFVGDQILYPLINHGHYSEKLKYNYSILTHQRTMTEQEYNYLRLIQKNTTVTGSLFDPMPSELHGNISSVTVPEEIVVGYVGAYTTSSKRFFIKGTELDIRYPGACRTRVVTQDSFYYYFVTASHIPIDSIGVNPFNLQEFSGALNTCMDCRLRGTPIRPDFFKE